MTSQDPRTTNPLYLKQKIENLTKTDIEKILNPQKTKNLQSEASDPLKPLTHDDVITTPQKVPQNNVTGQILSQKFRHPLRHHESASKPLENPVKIALAHNFQHP